MEGRTPKPDAVPRMRLYTRVADRFNYESGPRISGTDLLPIHNAIV